MDKSKRHGDSPHSPFRGRSPLKTPFVIAVMLLIYAASPADAQLANVAMADLYSDILQASQGWLQRAAEIALNLLAATAVIGFAISVKDLILSGNVTMESIVATLVRHIFIIGLVVWLLQAPQRLAFITLSIRRIGSSISGQDTSFAGLLMLYSDIVGPLVDFTLGLRWRDLGIMICMAFMIFLIHCLFFMIATTVLMVEIEAVFILIGGLFTSSFFVIGYFRDLFMSYIRALVAVGVKMLMLSLCLGIMRNIMATWPAMITAHLNSSESVFSFIMPMVSALLGFYMILKAAPQFAASMLTGSVSSMDGGLVKAAVVAGYGLTMTVAGAGAMAAKKVAAAGSTVEQAAQTYMYTSQAAQDTGASKGGARATGIKEALKTLATGPQAGGARAAGDRMYSDHQRAVQFADVRGTTADANTVSDPATKTKQQDQKTQTTQDTSDTSSSSPAAVSARMKKTSP